jgi:6-phospho-3-hexuloisomerase
MQRSELQAKSDAVLAELRDSMKHVDSVAFHELTTALLAAPRVFLHGLGREGLQMKGLAMRLFHLGLDAHVVGEMTTPAIGKGDVLFVSSGPGDFGSIRSLIAIAREAGARIAVVTAATGSETTRNADLALVLPAQTMADDLTKRSSQLPMGSLFEVAMMLSFELLALHVRDLKGETSETMRKRHTNLE